MKQLFKAQGGDADKWLNLDFSPDADGNQESFSEVKTEWAQSVTKDGDLAMTGLVLVPIWKLVKSVDPKKGAAYESFLKTKWRNAEIALAAKRKGVKGRLDLVVESKKLKSIIDLATKTELWNVKQWGSADGWVNTWTAVGHKKRNENWRDAAGVNRDYFEGVLARLEGGSSILTVAEFKKELAAKVKKYLVDEDRWWGPTGADSVQHNKVYKYNWEQIEKLQELL